MRIRDPQRCVCNLLVLMIYSSFYFSSVADEMLCCQRLHKVRYILDSLKG